MYSIRQPGTYTLTIGWRGRLYITSAKDGDVGSLKHRSWDTSFSIDLMDNNDLSECVGESDNRPQTRVVINVSSRKSS
jgi:hypothetical protein